MRNLRQLISMVENVCHPTQQNNSCIAILFSANIIPGGENSACTQISTKVEKMGNWSGR